MKQFVFYTTEGYTYAPNSENVENCQILAFETANDKNEAMDLFKARYAYLSEQGFSMAEVVCREIR